eukprot:TRINITY_DN9759_c0_g1_i1.p1 TRINITY_DN9759_c0_g1~~TRINITY_DN9759_c0_g1_i1.p1  ORF type:complete len:489 (-),score=88.81 TRINITY_DN9759_c0_g1_i1:4-1470(-)
MDPFDQKQMEKESSESLGSSVLNFNHIITFSYLLQNLKVLAPYRIGSVYLVNDKNDPQLSDKVHSETFGELVTPADDICENLHTIFSENITCFGGRISLANTKKTELLQFRVQIDEIGEIDLANINEESLGKLLSVSKQAPFGDLKTMRTIVDRSVRDAKELEPSQWSLHQKDNCLDSLVGEMRRRFGTDRISLEKGKLNIYGPGGFFLEHQDTPTDTSSMIATIVICFPTEFTGGELVVKQGFKETVFDFAKHDGKIRFATFYSDCLHEVKPVLSGHRITLTFYAHVGKFKGEFSQDTLWRWGSRLRHSVTKKGGVHSGLMMGRIKRLTENLLKLSCANHNVGIILYHKYPTDSVEPHCLKGCDKRIYSYLKETYREITLLPVILTTHQVIPNEESDEKSSPTNGTVFAFTREIFDHFCKVVKTQKFDDEKAVSDVLENQNITFFDINEGGYFLRKDEEEGADWTGNYARDGYLQCTYFTIVLIPKL